MKKNILSMAALLIASAAVFTACSSDDNITSEQPANSVQKTYTMTVNATKGGDATTRALTLGRNDANTKNVLNATWATTENVYVKKGDTWANGSLQPESDGATATLKGELSGIGIAADDVLTLQFPKSGDISYDGQVGTLEDIAANFDYATATVTVASVSATGNIVPTTATTTFENHQAIVKFTLTDKATSSAINTTKLVISVGATDYTINPTSATNVIYAAIPGFTGQTVKLTTTVGDNTYIYEKANVSFTNGQYYEIGVKMIVYPVALSAVTADYHGSVICSDGTVYPPKTAVPDGKTAVGILGKVTETGHGLILALNDAIMYPDWNDINNWTSVKTYAGTTLKLLPDDARGTNLTSYTALGETAVSNWAVAKKSDYAAIFTNLGSTTGDGTGKTYDSNVNAYITTGVGGTALSPSGVPFYWSATQEDGTYAWYFNDSYWSLANKEGNFKIRPVLGFGEEAEEQAAPTLAQTMTTANLTVKVKYNYGNWNYENEENYCQFLSNGDGTYTFQSGGGDVGGRYNKVKALVVENGKLVFKQNYYDSDEYWEWNGFSVTFDTSNNTYSEWRGGGTLDYNPYFISVEVDGTKIDVTPAE